MPTIEELHDARRQADLLIQQKAAAVYASFDKNERTCVRFGMFPAVKRRPAETELLAMLDNPRYNAVDVARLLSVAIMDAANKGPEKMIC
jgi:hypothetical protein